MRTTFSFTAFFILTVSLNLFSQGNFQYEISLVPVTVDGLPGLHSYAWAQSQGKWLIIGGRKDGLHARQPFFSFPASQNNTDMYVVDVAGNQVWSSSVISLPAGLKEQLQSTNMNFYQDGDTLYIIGGYGFSATANGHITYPYLTAVSVSGLVGAIQNNQPVAPFFRQISDDIFAVSGGHLKKLNGLFFLVGGHRFDGRYNPMGEPTFTQTYTNQIRKFTIDNSGPDLTFANFTAITDPVHLRRRDYNLLPQIFPDRQQGFTISSGVFQLNADLPFLYPVDIFDSGYNPVTGFNQYLSHYHSATACLYDSAGNNMHSIFFGGMSQYYYQNGTLVRDDLVPFVKTISRLTRDSTGNLTEYQLSAEMPALKGAGAEFIPNPALPHYSNKVIRLDDIVQNSFIIGHIYGGILSPSLNPFSINQTNTTSADKMIYEVWLTASPLSLNEQEINGKNPYEIEIFPNPFIDEFSVNFTSDQAVAVSYVLTNNLGQIVSKTDNMACAAGKNSIKIKPDKKHKRSILFITVIFDDKFYATRKLLRQ